MRVTASHIERQRCTAGESVFEEPGRLPYGPVGPRDQRLDLLDYYTLGQLGQDLIETALAPPRRGES